MVFFPNVSSDFQPTEDVNEGHEEKDGSNTAVGGIWFLGISGVGVAWHEVGYRAWKAKHVISLLLYYVITLLRYYFIMKF